MQQSLNDIWHMADYSQQMHRTVNQKVNRPNKIFPRNLLSVLNEYMHYSTELANSIKQGVAFKGKGWLVMYPKKVFQSLFQSAHVDDHLNIKKKNKKKKKNTDYIYFDYTFWLKHGLYFSSCPSPCAPSHPTPFKFFSLRFISFSHKNSLGGTIEPRELYSNFSFLQNF